LSNFLFQLISFDLVRQHHFKLVSNSPTSRAAWLSFLNYLFSPLLFATQLTHYR